MIRYEEHKQNESDFNNNCNDNSYSSWCGFICERYGFNSIEEYEVDTEPYDDGYDYDRYY